MASQVQIALQRIRLLRARARKVGDLVRSDRAVPRELQIDDKEMIALENHIASIAATELGVASVDKAIWRPFWTATYEDWDRSAGPIHFWEAANRHIASTEEFLASFDNSPHMQVREWRNDPRPLETRDVFLCHASEDKQAIVDPLRAELEKAGISCWYDRAEITWGDSLTHKVNEGLRTSRYVVVVLSRSFLAKNWPRRELDAAINLEASSGEVKVLPLIIGSSDEQDAIIKQLPLINDKFHLRWGGASAPIVQAMKDRLRRREIV